MEPTDDATAPASAPGRRGLEVLGWLAGGATLVGILAAVVTAAMAAAPRDDEPQNPDAVMVLGGAGVERAELGLELSRRYGAVLVLSSSAIWYGEEELGLVCGRDAICVDPAPENTMGEAREAAALAAEHGWGHLTVATSTFHTSRARILFQQCLGDRVTVVGADPPPDEPVGLGRQLREVPGILAAWTVQRAC